MTKNEFKVISIFKIIIRISKKFFEFCGETSKFLAKRCLFISCIFYLNEEDVNPTSMSEKYIKNEIFNSTSHKTKTQKKRSKKIIQLRDYPL